MRLLLLFALAACGGKEGDDTAADDTPADDTSAPGPSAVATTVADVPCADADGRSDASTLTLSVDGHLYAGLRSLDRDAGWVSDSGHALQVDCAPQRVSQSWATSARADASPHTPGALLASVLGEGLEGDDVARCSSVAPGDMLATSLVAFC